MHRFAVAYQHNRQKASTFSSLLEKIPGVGPATAQKLMEKFGTLEKVKKARKEQLMEIPGLSETVAEHILAFFAEEE